MNDRADRMIKSARARKKRKFVKEITDFKVKVNSILHGLKDLNNAYYNFDLEDTSKLFKYKRIISACSYIESIVFIAPSILCGIIAILKVITII